MKTIILILIIAIGLGVSLRARWVRAASETANGSLWTEHDTLRQNVARERQRLQSARDAHAAARAVAPAAAARTTTSKSRKLSPEAALASNPALLAESLQCWHDTPEWGMGHLFRAVGFSSRQIEQWKQMVVQDRQRHLELIAAVERQGLDRNSETFRTLSAENERLLVARKTEILGDLEPRYREYRQLDGTRGLVEWLTRTGVYLDEPITGEQVERATQILAANTREVLRSGNGQQAPIVDWPAATGQLKDILSPAQIATLQRVGEQFEKVSQASQRVDERTKLLTAQFQSQPRR